MQIELNWQLEEGNKHQKIQNWVFIGIRFLKCRCSHRVQERKKSTCLWSSKMGQNGSHFPISWKKEINSAFISFFLLIEEEVECLKFDYMQNLLPKIPVQEMFYLWKLWFYVFCTYDVKTGLTNVFTYPEGVANRGPDEACSLLWMHIQEVSGTIKELHNFNDACWG